ncbi:hypothetical protein NL676_022028 [Syzygium grande]|nr:hypothetical protein NL676_022028 [Syzygium grande]
MKAAKGQGRRTYEGNGGAKMCASDPESGAASCGLRRSPHASRVFPAPNPIDSAALPTMDGNNIPLPFSHWSRHSPVVSAPSELGISGFPVRYLEFLPAKDPVAMLEMREHIVREKWIDIEKAKILRDRVKWCYRVEGINHLQKCRHLVRQHLESTRGIGWGKDGRHPSLQGPKVESVESD